MSALCCLIMAADRTGRKKPHLLGSRAPFFVHPYFSLSAEAKLRVASKSSELKSFELMSLRGSGLELVQLCDLSLDLGQLLLIELKLSLSAFDDLSWGLGDESFVIQLGLTTLDHAFELGSHLT